MGKPKIKSSQLVIDESFIDMISKLLKYFEGDIRKTKAWIITPNLNLGGFAPLKLWMMGKGENVVEFIEMVTISKVERREWTLYGSDVDTAVDGPELKHGDNVRVREVLS